jgi:hypothetical protein
MALFFDFKSRSSSCSWMCCAIAAGVRPSTVVFGEWARRRGVRLRCIGRLGQQRARAFERPRSLAQGITKSALDEVVVYILYIADDGPTSF